MFRFLGPIIYSNSDVFYKYPSLLNGSLYSVHAISHHELVDIDMTTPKPAVHRV